MEGFYFYSLFFMEDQEEVRIAFEGPGTFNVQVHSDWSVRVVDILEDDSVLCLSDSEALLLSHSLYEAGFYARLHSTQ